MLQDRIIWISLPAPEKGVPFKIKHGYHKTVGEFLDQTTFTTLSSKSLIDEAKFRLWEIQIFLLLIVKELCMKDI